jgi:hypothetical protein
LLAIPGDVCGCGDLLLDMSLVGTHLCFFFSFTGACVGSVADRDEAALWAFFFVPGTAPAANGSAAVAAEEVEEDDDLVASETGGGGRKTAGLELSVAARFTSAFSLAR